MRSLIISDIHNKINQVEEIIETYRDINEIVFLGDYFDDFGDNSTIAKKVAIWLKDSLTKSNRIHLLGNHELNYMYNGVDICGGYTLQKKEAINEILNSDDWSKLRFYYDCQGWLCTHAGCSGDLFGNSVTGNISMGYITKQMDRGKDCLFLKNINQSKIFQVGAKRGGFCSVGGPLWCHFPEEFVPIANIKQVFGHTIQSHVNNINCNYCIDTNLKQLAIVNDGRINIVEGCNDEKNS